MTQSGHRLVSCTPLPRVYRRVYIPCPVPQEPRRESNETARVHHAGRRRSGYCLAGGGVRESKEPLAHWGYCAKMNFATHAREDAMAYDLNQFIADCPDILARDPGPGGREEVRANLERLLANSDFVETYCGDSVPRGLNVLYEDPKLGFQILAHINDKARVSPPHDHGASWAIYSQAPNTPT